MTATAVKIEIPQAMRKEHAELHAALEAATGAPGRVGEAAREVARVLHPHFVREEEIALPPLGLLRELAGDGVSPAMAGVLPLTDALKAELPRMLEEHVAIRAALQKLAAAARAERRPDVAELAERVMVHAATEEQVSYPAAVLVGEYVRLALEPAKRGAMAAA
ncbi:MAG TPA: hemerythrin domain-containing protein [Longimicrobium sp.]|nr:hemerythrin domain-containing protein [Longimicrobium sp.]